MRVWLSLLCAACSGAQPTVLQQPATAPLELRVTSAVQPEGGAERVVVSVDRIRARFDCCGVMDLAYPLQPIDLLAREPVTLLTARTPASRMTWIELEISRAGDRYVVTRRGQRFPLEVEQGREGVRVSTDVRAATCAQGHLTLGFARETELEPGDTWKLKPVIDLTEIQLEDAPCDPSVP